MTTSTTATGSEPRQVPIRNEQSTVGKGTGFFAKAWRTVSAVIGTLLGLLPHVLHHAGLIFGAALVTGVGGNMLFGAVGLLFTVPLLRRLHARFHTWKAPAIALAIFVAMFSVSAFVVGPAISGGSPADSPAPGQDHSTHDGH